jgi:hypothetical protein
MKRLAQHGLFVVVAILNVSGTAMAADHPDECTVKTLRGTYVFAATGHNIVAGVAQPKAIVEVIEFDGNGILSAPAATRSLNGVIAHGLVGSGGYTVETSCIGTIAFDGPGPTFDMFFSPGGEKLWLIQTNPNTVFQGTATRVSNGRLRDQN